MRIVFSTERNVIMQLRHFVFLIILVQLFFSCRSIDHLADTKAKTIRVVNIPPDSLMTSITTPYKVKMELKMNEIIAQVEEMMTKERPESKLTNWVADALYNQAKKYFNEEIAFAYQNFGGIRIPSLSPGALTIGKIFELMPFDNTLVLVKMKAEELVKFIDYIAEIEGGPTSSNIKLVILNKKVESLLLNQKPIDYTKEYLVAMPDYIANGGDNQSYLIDNERIDKHVLLRSVLIDEAIEQKILKSNLDQRIVVKK